MAEWWWPLTTDQCFRGALAGLSCRRDTISGGEGKVLPWSSCCLCWACNCSEGSAGSGIQFMSMLN